MRPSFQPVVRDAEDQNLLGLRLRSSEYHPHFLDSPESRTQTLVSTPPPSSCSSRPSERLRRLAPPPLYIPEASFFMDSDTHLVTTSTAVVKEPVTALNFPVSATSLSDYTYDKLIMNNESNESPLSFHLSLEGMQPEQTAGLPLDPPPLRRVQALSLPPITPAPVYGWGPVPSTYFGTDDGYNRIPTPEVEFDLDLELTVDDSIVTHETSPPQTERVLSPLNLHFPNPSEDLEDRISKCVDAVEWIRLSLGSGSLIPRDQIDSLCNALTSSLCGVRAAVHSSPSDARLLLEEHSLNWRQKYESIFESLEKNISYFFLLADSIGQRPPRIHRVENLLEKLWAYAHKFQNLEMKLTTFHDHVRTLAIRSNLKRMNEAARKELEEERARRQSFKAASQQAKVKRQELRTEIRRIQDAVGTSRAAHSSRGPAR
ncbi:hypothetical protein EW026_g6640 [Hermanssonia centrifuga]|uniref:Uncharacterized protein n=1 Tax=Hermanssonia centrifuga TaxID=98765 RepID=A0A4S4KEQ7_9APHY|nr:hypothetical protein EW026_g6640 [Hermanssonia centrifuga]